MNTVLVVDDDPISRNVIARSLSDSGYSIFEAANAAEAVQLMSMQRDIAAAVLHCVDLMNTAAEIAAIRRTLPIIVASATADAHRDVSPWPVTVSYVSFPKPLTPGVLVDHLRRLLHPP